MLRILYAYKTVENPGFEVKGVSVVGKGYGGRLEASTESRAKHWWGPWILEILYGNKKSSKLDGFIYFAWLNLKWKIWQYFKCLKFKCSVPCSYPIQSVCLKENILRYIKPTYLQKKFENISFNLFWVFINIKFGLLQLFF